MIKSFQHAGLEKFYKTGSKAGIQTDHAKRLSLRLGTLNNAVRPEDMNVPGWDLHVLLGDRQGVWSIRVNGNWRMTFRFEEQDAVLVNYEDYH